MSKDPAILFFIDNWLVSTKEMKADERGWYLNLILHQFDKKDLPSDIEELANLADVRFSEFDLFKQKWEQVLKHRMSDIDLFLAKNPEQKGSSHWNWKGGITSENVRFRNSLDYINWRKRVFLRDSFTCKQCGKTGGKLNAHHIKRFSKHPYLRLDINNGITLCKSCHTQIHKTKNYGT